MYFIRYQPLKDRLRSRSVSDREALPYLVLMTVFGGLIMSIIPLFESFNFWDGVYALLSAAIAVGGVLHVYERNGGASGFDLIQKNVILGWVLGIRFLIGFIPVAVVVFVIGEVANVITYDHTGPYDVIFMLAAEIVFFQRLGHHISDTTSSGNASATDAVGSSTEMAAK